MRKKITLEDLAGMVKRGFDAVDKRLDQTATKDDLKRIQEKVEGLEQKMEENFQHVNARLDALREDISDLPEIRQGLRDLEARVARIERRAGVAK